MNNQINIEELRKKYSITEEEFNITAENIFKELSMNVYKTDKPKFIMIAGMPGAGKTDLVSKKFQDLNQNAIIIDQDELRAQYPKYYSQIVEQYDDKIEYQILKPYVTNIIKYMVTHSREKGYNVILESAFQKINRFIDYTKAFKNDGYETELSLLSVTNLESNISMLYRYCYFVEKDGICRYNTSANFDNNVDKVYENLTLVTQDNIFDNIEIYIRNTNRNFLPTKTYSMKENPSTNPLTNYLISKEQSIVNTIATFEEKYEYIKSILQKHMEQDKLLILEQLYQQFLNVRYESR